MNFDQVVRLSANFYLKHYHRELKLVVNALEIEEFNPDVIKFSDLILTQENSRLNLSGFQLHLAPEKPYWLSRLILDKGQLLLDLDSLSQLLAVKEKSGHGDSAALYRELLSALSALPDIKIKELSAELFSPRKKVRDKLLLVDSHLDLMANTRVSINLTANRQDLVSLQAGFDAKAIAGELTADLGKLNSLTARYFEQPLMITGKLNSDFTLIPAAASWSLAASNQVSNSRLDLSGITGEAASFLVDGDFTLNYRDNVLKAATGQGSELIIKPAAETVKSLKGKLKQKKLKQDINRYLLENIPYQVIVAAGSTVNLDINKTLLSGKLQLDSQLKNGEISIKLPKFTITGQAQTAHWQLDYQQQQPIEQLGKALLSLQGEMLYSPLETTLAVKAGELLLKEVKHQEQRMQQGVFELAKPTLIQFRDDQVRLSETLLLTSVFERVQIEQQSFEQIRGEHNVQQIAAALGIDSTWQLDDALSLTSEHLFDKNVVKGKLMFDNTPLSELLARAELPELLSLDGQMDNEIHYEFDLAAQALSARVSGQLLNGFGSYDDIVFDDIKGRWSCFWQEPQLSCEQLSFSGGEVDAGIDITEVISKGKFFWQQDNWSYQLGQFSAGLLGGAVSLAPVDIFSDQAFSGTLTLTHISLAELVALQQQPGIDVTGFLDGELPFSYDSNGLSIKRGILVNQGEGIIKVDGNPAVEQLKQSQPGLKFALDALKKLHYQHLGSEVTMSPDGATEIKMSMQGRNPDIARPIHFNYLHQENLLQLLRSLRIDSQLSEDIEQAISK
ncbi:YdbH domain-containing protein [Thalassomonas haliotis]|uniref:YdbH domain-containing protein n=1 Tax=Thalassomonas haliotis TaxID=485448 RepID=A0ABY7V8U3_9GAMM|nr:YdbH domain-containing protein [Thalassomonas haliotis]WDE10023.1 YdbH domain-containing protein [Thalassomonas haliotis]